jgi:hypothetical protein
VFSTRNHDGNSGLGEPVNTVPAADQAGTRKVAVWYGRATTGELYLCPTLGQYVTPSPAERGRRHR